MGWPTR
ncbi:hypothetical protein PENVUL_c153G04894 [Penicillium vulpinum]|nr:hypothetical protein PENVUL_c153G04894 [Penicillium vulpinum]